MRSISLRASSFVTKVLRFLPTEVSHAIALHSLDLISFLGIKLVKENLKKEPIKILGQDFKNRLGIAGGLDKDGEHINSLSGLGVAFLELGTATPRPQLGNKKPRLFRDTENLSLLNRMGFNNKGVLNLVRNIKSYEGQCKLLISIGKNFDTPNEKSIDDYLFCLEKVFPIADIVTVNVSSPNTKGLRALHKPKSLSGFLNTLKKRQLELSKRFNYKPLAVKISPDISKNECKEISKILLGEGIDGLIATNTTSDHNDRNGKGGLSGKLLFKKSTIILEEMRNLLGKEFPIIASGGVMDIDSYRAKLEAGADLVQVYTGMIYKGPELIEELLNEH